MTRSTRYFDVRTCLTTAGGPRFSYGPPLARTLGNDCPEVREELGIVERPAGDPGSAVAAGWSRRVRRT